MRSKVEVASTQSSTYKENCDLIIMPFCAPWQNYEKRLLVSSCLSLCLSDCLPGCLSVHVEPLGPPLEGILRNLMGTFRKFVMKIQDSLKSDKNNVRVLYLKTSTHLWTNLAQSFIEWKISPSLSCRENRNTHFVLYIYFFFFSKISQVYSNLIKIWQE